VAVGLAAEGPWHRLEQADVQSVDIQSVDVESAREDEVAERFGREFPAAEQLGIGADRPAAGALDHRRVLDVGMLVGAVLELAQEGASRARSIAFLDAPEHLQAPLLVARRQVPAMKYATGERLLGLGRLIAVAGEEPLGHEYFADAAGGELDTVGVAHVGEPVGQRTPDVAGQGALAAGELTHGHEATELALPVALDQRDPEAIAVRALEPRGERRSAGQRHAEGVIGARPRRADHVAEGQRIGDEHRPTALHGRVPDAVGVPPGDEPDRGATVQRGEQRGHKLEARRRGSGGDDHVAGAQPEALGDAGGADRHRARLENARLRRPRRARCVGPEERRGGTVAVRSAIGIHEHVEADDRGVALRGQALGVRLGGDDEHRRDVRDEVGQVAVRDARVDRRRGRAGEPRPQDMEHERRRVRRAQPDRGADSDPARDQPARDRPGSAESLGEGHRARVVDQERSLSVASGGADEHTGSVHVLTLRRGGGGPRG
jgi:hypothetical protein